MLVKRVSTLAFTLLGSLILCGGLARADVLYTGTITLLSTDPTQLGRLNRDGNIPDWSAPKPFPGALNLTTSYHYEAISVQVPSGLSFLAITIDSNDANIFASLYDTAYLPDSSALNRGLDVNYLGDAGGSGNFFGTSPRFFQVVDQTAANSMSGFATVLLVLNETVTNAGLNSPVDVLVEGFCDTDFDGLGQCTGGGTGGGAVPEPGTLAPLCAGLIVLVAAYRRNRRSSSVAIISGGSPGK